MPRCEAGMLDKLPKVAVKVNKETLLHKGDHFFHSTYLAAEAFMGHGVPSMIALGALIVVVLSIVLHVEGVNG